MTALVTDAGLGEFVAAMVATSVVKYLGWGGGSGQGETAVDLASAFAETRSTGTLAAADTNVTGDTLRITGSIAALDARAVTELGVFSSASGEDLDIYGDFEAIDLLAGDNIAFTVDVIVDQKEV